MKKLTLLLVSLVALSLFASCSPSASNDWTGSLDTSSINQETTSEQEDIERERIYGDLVNSYLTKEKTLTEYKDVDSFDDKSRPYTIVINENDTSKKYHFTLEAEGYSSKLEVNDVSSTIKVHNLLAGTRYTWKAISGDETLTGEFNTSFGPRFITVNGINNVRDIGAYFSSPIKQGLIYRGSELNNHYTISESGLETMNNILKIKSDIDIRGASDAKNITESPLGSEVNFVPIRKEFKSYGVAITTSTQNDNIQTIFNVLSNKENYPVYIHCYQGADRTGTICELIEGLMGVEDETRFIDFTLTTFSSGKDCYRDGTDGSHIYGNIKKYIDMLYKEETYSKSIERFLTEKCGVTKDVIDAVKLNLSTSLDSTSIGELYFENI